MTDPKTWVAQTYCGLADLLAGEPAATWNTPSLCEEWQVRHVIAHVTMPTRLTPETFAAEMATAGGDFTALSNTIALRDARLPIADQLAALRSELLHAWQPPGGGTDGALNHAVIHSLDVTVTLGRQTVAPSEAVTAVLDRLTDSNGTLFGLDLAGLQFEAADSAWSWGEGDCVRAEAGSLVALLSGRTLPDGQALPRQ